MIGVSIMGFYIFQLIALGYLGLILAVWFVVLSIFYGGRLYVRTIQRRKEKDV